MDKHRFVSFVIAAIALFACAAGVVGAQAVAKATSSARADRAAIEALWVSYSKSAMEGNLDAFLALHERDAYKMPHDQPMFQPWAIVGTLRASWAKRVQTTTLRMRVDPKEIEILGHYAYTMGTYVETLIPKDGGAQSVFDGKFLTVLHKGADGTWRILRDCYNSNRPPGN